VLGRRTIAFVHALRHSDPRADLERVLDPTDAARADAGVYKPAVLLLMVGEWIGRNLRAGRIDGGALPAFELSLDHLTDALGGCERIASTPIPFTHSVIIHRTI
jgi:putative membrane protein